MECLWHDVSAEENNLGKDSPTELAGLILFLKGCLNLCVLFRLRQNVKIVSRLARSKLGTSYAAFADVSQSITENS